MSVSVSVSDSCSAQSESEEKLIGKWILVAKTDSFPDDIEPLSENDSESNSNSKTELEKTTLTFKKDKTFEILTLRYGYDSTYKLTDSTLTLGNRDYIIVRLNNPIILLMHWFFSSTFFPLHL